MKVGTGNWELDHSKYYDDASVGVFTNGVDTYVASVFKVKGRDCYKFSVDGNSTSGLTKRCPLECWEDLSNWLGAVLVKVDGKWLNRNFGNLYIKPYKNNIAITKGRSGLGR